LPKWETEMWGDRIAPAAIAGVLAASFVTAVLAGPPPSAAGISITVFADSYVVDGRAFDDLNLLEKHVSVMHVRGISLLACGPRATRSLKAAVHRFRHVPMQIRPLEPDEPECSKVVLAIPVGERIGQRPRGIDDEAVERYWLELTP
jgi:hypothetical protein